MSLTYLSHNETNDIQIGGTSLLGYVDTRYDRLVHLFGEPTSGDEFKVDAEWDVLITDDSGYKHVVTIYNWKNGVNYLGKEDGIPVENIRRWNVGGNNIWALGLLKTIISEQF